MSAFDKIAKTGTKKTASKERIAAEVNASVKKAVDTVITNKAEIKSLTAEIAENEALIIDHVRPQQDDMAYAGKFTKSLEVPGTTASVLYSTSDRFSVPQDEDSQTALKELLGNLYDDFFISERAISIKRDVLNNEKLLNKICKACEKAGLNISEIFDVGDTIKAQKGLDEKQYKLNKENLETFRTLVRQNKPALK